MSSVVDTGRSKWELAQQALASFIGQPGSSGLSVGLMVFPLNGADCTAASYSQALVGFGELPGHAGAVRDMLAMIRPGGGTPMGPAFQGGIATLRAYLQANPRRKGALVLVTDGVPEDCTPLNPRGLAGIAADGFTGAPSITTYAVGVFAKDEEAQGRPILEAITAMGGSAQPFIVDPTLGLDQKLLETLAAIGGVALPCSFPVPQPSTAAVDYAKVSVHFSSASDKEIPYVSGSTRCDAAQGGWYYDDRLPPSRIILCPQSCQSLKAVAGTKVDLRYGCKPIVIP